MPLYEFENEDGELEEHFLPMAEAPNFGAKLVIDGKKLTRTFPRSVRVTTKADVNFKAWSQPHLLHDGTLPPGAIKAPRYDKDGVPVFSSRKERDEYVAKSDGRVVLD